MTPWDFLISANKNSFILSVLVYGAFVSFFCLIALAAIGVVKASFPCSGF